MRRAVLVAAWLAAFVSSGAEAKYSPVHRVSAAPGVTLEVPDGFVACDPETNRALHNAPTVKVLAGLCAKLGNRPGMVVMVNFDPAAPVFVVGLNVPEYDMMSEEFFSQATPEMVAGFDNEICGKILKLTMQLQSCSVHAGLAGGRHVLVADAQTVGGKDSIVMRGYLFSRGVGLTEISVMAPWPGNAKTHALTDRIAASMTIAPPAPPQPPVLVGMTPLPGMTLSIPKGWIACDDANNAQLGAVEDPFDVASMVCTRSLGPGDIRFFYPHLPNMTFMRITTAPAKIDDATFAQGLTSEALQAKKESDCKRAQSGLDAEAVRDATCDTSAGTIGGHPAEIITTGFSGTREGGVYHAAGRSYITVVDGKVFVVAFIASSVFEPKFDAVTDAVLSSVAFP